MIPTVIAYDVEYIFPMGVHSLLFITKCGTLWGLGQNQDGELGDGTRVPRTDPVKIAENVTSAGWHTFLTQDGTLWRWTRNDPTPQPVYENVVAVGNVQKELKA